MQTTAKYPGIPGLFIAGVFGAALSSLSVVLNSTALVIQEDIVKGCFKKKLSPKAANILVKSSILTLGIIGMVLIFVLEHLSGILSVATSFTSIAAGTTFGMFTLGMMVPFSSNIGCIAGGVCGFFASAIVVFGNQILIALKRVHDTELAYDVSDCPGNLTLPEPPPNTVGYVFPLFHISYHFISPIALFVTLLVGILVSLCTRRDLKTVDADLICPIFHR